MKTYRNANTVESRDIYEEGNQLGNNVSSVVRPFERPAGFTVVAQICRGHSLSLLALWMTVLHIPGGKGCLQ